jgi:hypothetical protein
MGLSLSAAYFMYGFTLIFVVPAINFCLPKPKRGRMTWFSLSVIPWYYHNALTYLVRYTFLDFITPTPFNLMFFKMMGMKIGKGTMINTSNISDPCLIEIGDYVTIGGSATLIAHYGMKGFLVIDRLEIRARPPLAYELLSLVMLLSEKVRRLRPMMCYFLKLVLKINQRKKPPRIIPILIYT